MNFDVAKIQLLIESKYPIFLKAKIKIKETSDPKIISNITAYFFFFL